MMIADSNRFVFIIFVSPDSGLKNRLPNSRLHLAFQPLRLQREGREEAFSAGNQTPEE
jgi:hypothetical protein